MTSFQCFIRLAFCGYCSSAASFSVISPSASRSLMTPRILSCAAMQSFFGTAPIHSISSFSIFTARSERFLHIFSFVVSFAHFKASAKSCASTARSIFWTAWSLNLTISSNVRSDESAAWSAIGRFSFFAVFLIYEMSSLPKWTKTSRGTERFMQ